MAGDDDRFMGGMRRVVTLAAALALPAEFPQRSPLTFIAFVVIIVTLLLQRLTLPMLAKKPELPPSTTNATSPNRH
jgi:NhaP-type Na+/H+ or K+/H+ antiporter